MIDFDEIYDPELEEILEAGVTEDDRQKGTEMWSSAQTIFSEEPEFVGVAEQSVPEGLNDIFGKGTEEFMKCSLIDFWFYWFLTGNSEDSKDKEELEMFSPLDLTILIRTLSKTILDQNTRIENLEYALNKVMEDKNKQ